jgi:hypothetical protein
MEINMDRKVDMPRIGIVASRTCPTCGHHEVGFTDKTGVFRPLVPGTMIQILEGHTDHILGPEDLETIMRESRKEPEPETGFRPWVPEPVKGDRSLRLKYGVMIPEHLEGNKISVDVFQAAYIEKLQGLIGREIYTPLAVILDQFFIAPHLGSGNPEEIALNMWLELDEIREPADLVRAWLQEPNDQTLSKLIHPKSLEELGSIPVNDEGLKKELETMSLEEFLRLL